MLLEPLGEAAVQFGAGRLRERVVGGVADQEVAEAVCVLAAAARPVGTDEIAPHERREARCHLVLLRCERLHRAAVEELPFDRAALEHPPLRLVELVEPRGEQRPQRRRHLDLSVSAASAAISVRKSGLPPEARTIRSRSLVRHAVAESASASSAGSGSSRSAAGQPGAGRAAPAAPCRGAGAARRREQRRRLDQVEECLLAPLDVVEDDHERRLLLQQLAERPGDLVRAGADVALARAATGSRVAAASSLGSAPSCFTTSTTGQYVIPSP